VLLNGQEGAIAPTYANVDNLAATDPSTTRNGRHRHESEQKDQPPICGHCRGSVVELNETNIRATVL
jgi:hypothetical protein